MKTTKYYFILVIILTQMILFRGTCSSMPAGGESEVMKAFNLRMNGKVDDAKTLLESVLAKDSTNAMAWYELARLKQYMLIGGGKVTMDEVTSAAGKAVKFEPKNATYAYYNAVSLFLNAFMAMQQQNQDLVKTRLGETCAAFDKTLELKPDYPQAMLYLVEIYGMLPKDMGGDSLKALVYAAKLDKMSAYYGAKGRADLMPDGSDLVSYWKGILAKDAKNADILMETGKACLMSDDPTQAEVYFNTARKTDRSKNILVLDMARFHMYKVMRNREVAKTELPIAKTYLESYLKTTPPPVVPLKAYAKGLQARCENILGNKEAGEKIMKETKALDPYFSGASGIPTLLLFDPPTQVPDKFFSFFMPY